VELIKDELIRRVRLGRPSPSSGNTGGDDLRRAVDALGLEPCEAGVGEWSTGHRAGTDKTIAHGPPANSATCILSTFQPDGPLPDRQGIEEKLDLRETGDQTPEPYATILGHGPQGKTPSVHRSLE